jgi:hypothetical protein
MKQEQLRVETWSSVIVSIHFRFRNEVIVFSFLFDDDLLHKCIETPIAAERIRDRRRTSRLTNDRSARDGVIKNVMDKRTYFLLQSASTITLRKAEERLFVIQEPRSLQGSNPTFYRFQTASKIASKEQ